MLQTSTMTPPNPRGQRVQYPQGLAALRAGPGQYQMVAERRAQYLERSLMAILEAVLCGFPVG
jgi:hypothetical protein